MSQTISREPERHDEHPPAQHVGIPAQRQADRPTDWVGLYHREGVPVRPDGHPIEEEQPGEWGWHGEMGKWGRRLWVLPFGLIVAYLVTDIVRGTEGGFAALWLIGIGLLMLLLVFVDWRRRKNAWRSE